MSSSMASTRHAASWPSGVPAPEKVGLLGKNWRELISLKYLTAQEVFSLMSRVMLRCSAAAMLLTTRPEHCGYGLVGLTSVVSEEKTTFKNVLAVREDVVAAGVKKPSRCLGYFNC